MFVLEHHFDGAIFHLFSTSFNDSCAGSYKGQDGHLKVTPMMSATSQGAGFGESELSMEKVWKKCVLRKSESVVKVLPGFQKFAAKCGHAKKVLPQSSQSEHL